MCAYYMCAYYVCVNTTCVLTTCVCVLLVLLTMVQLISKLTLACSNTRVFLYICRITRTKLACDMRVIFRVEHASSILCCA